MKHVTQYNQTRVRLRHLARMRRKEADSRRQDVALLQRYYDLKRQHPTGIVDPALERNALAIEANFATENARIEQLQRESFAHKKAALSEIGTHFGRLARTDPHGTDKDKCRHWWLRANDYRQHHLDGIRLHWGRSDPEGPMFKAFAKASGMTPL